MNETVLNRIKKIIESHNSIPETADFLTYPYIDNGHVDSLAIMRFVAELESEFDVEIDDSEMVSDKFRTPKGLQEIINTKLSTSN